MNILMLLYKDIHYDARVQREALALAEAGYNVTIACVKEFGELPSSIHPKINYIRIPISVKSAKQKLSIQDHGSSPGRKGLLKNLLVKMIRNPLIKVVKDYLAYFEYYKKVESSVDLSSFDVIHCHDLNTLWQGSMLARNRNLYLIYDSHELFNEMAGRNEIDRSIGYFVEKRLYTRVDCLITVNTFMVEQFQNRYGKKPAVVIQNIPIVHTHDVEGTTANYWRSAYSLQESDIVLLYQGGLNPHRGIEECIKALEMLPNEYKLVLMGQGRLKLELQKLVNELKLRSRVFFHEQVPANDVLWYTKQADIGLVMYRNTSKNNYYSTPNKIFEYLQAEIPAVASKHPGKAYIVEQYQTGVCVEETPEAIAKGIQKVMEDLPAYKHNCKNGKDDLTWDNEKDKLVSLYKGVL